MYSYWEAYLSAISRQITQDTERINSSRCEKLAKLYISDKTILKLTRKDRPPEYLFFLNEYSHNIGEVATRHISFLVIYQSEPYLRDRVLQGFSQDFNPSIYIPVTKHTEEYNQVLGICQRWAEKQYARVKNLIST